MARNEDHGETCGYNIFERNVWWGPNLKRLTMSTPGVPLGCLIGDDMDESFRGSGFAVHAILQAPFFFSGI